MPNGAQMRAAKAQFREAKAEYDKFPVKCARPACTDGLSYGQWTRGHQHCSLYCATLVNAAAKRGKPKSHKPCLSKT
jgi:hypothetical protein